MNKKLIIGIVILLVLAVAFIIFKEQITGLIIREHNFKIYSSKSGLISSLDKELSFSKHYEKTQDDDYYAGGINDYRHYEYFSLVGIPVNAQIISAKVSLYRTSPGGLINMELRKVDELWEEYQTYNSKNRYPLTYEESVVVSGTEHLEFDVSDFIQKMILPWEQGGGNFGFEFSSEDAPRYFYLRNAPDEYKPKLEVVYK